MERVHNAAAPVLSAGAGIGADKAGCKEGCECTAIVLNHDTGDGVQSGEGHGPAGVSGILRAAHNRTARSDLAWDALRIKPLNMNLMPPAEDSRAG